MRPRGLLAGTVLAVGLMSVPAAIARGSGHRHGMSGPHGPPPHWGHGSWGGNPHVFVNGFFFGPPFFWDYPMYVPYPIYGYPPPPDGAWDYRAEAPPDDQQPPTQPPPPPPDEQARADTNEEPLAASYGLVQLRGVPDDAAIDLDGRFWMTAARLDQRWLALPRGAHTLTVRVRDLAPIERRVDVEPGKNQVIRFGPFGRSS
jgi:hypothetical protein